MIYDKDTLNHHRHERPGLALRYLGDVKLGTVGQSVRKALDNLTPINPETDAIEFYLLNGAVAEILRQKGFDEPLGPMNEIVEAYHDCLARAGHRLFNYLMLTSTRESRHLSGSQEDKLTAEHGYACTKFTKSAKSKAQKALWEHNAGDLTIGVYLDYLCDVYNKLSWGGSYGGKNWGKCTQPLRDVIHGEISIEMMLDVGFTLEHNTCSIFNKGLLYKQFSGSSMGKILDCQRAGRIPELIETNAVGEINGHHRDLLAKIKVAVPTMKVRPFVNWGLVTSLGAKSSYSHEKSAEISKWKNDPAFADEITHADKAALAAKQAQAAKAALAEKMYLTIAPGVKVKKAEAVR